MLESPPFLHTLTFRKQRSPIIFVHLTHAQCTPSIELSRPDRNCEKLRSVERRAVMTNVAWRFVPHVIRIRMLIISLPLCSTPYSDTHSVLLYLQSDVDLLESRMYTQYKPTRQRGKVEFDRGPTVRVYTFRYSGTVG